MYTLIFDLDGTLVDTVRLHYLTLQQTLMLHGIDLSYDQYITQFNGKTARLVMQTLFPDADDDAVSTYLAEKDTCYYHLVSQSSLKPLEGVVELLHYAQDRHIACAIASSARSAKFIADHIDISKYMQTIVTGNDISKSKPDPEIFLLAADRMHVQPGDCIVIEDAGVGIQGAKAAGMKTVGLTRSGDHSIYVADLIISSLAEYSHIINYFAL